jgi:hypothetical protein
VNTPTADTRRLSDIAVPEGFVLINTRDVRVSMDEAAAAELRDASMSVVLPGGQVIYEGSTETAAKGVLSLGVSFLDTELTFFFSRAGKMILTKKVVVSDAGEAVLAL